MKTTIATLVIAALVLTAEVSFAECRITQYPDHDEAVCDGTGKIAPSSQPSPQASSQASRETALSAGSKIAEQQPVPEEVLTQQQGDSSGEIRISMSQIGRRHAEYWLATTPRW